MQRASSTEQPTCVIVDDHDVVRTGLRLRLEHDGVVRIVGDAPDGTGALALVRATKPDVALLDISLPGMDGVEVAAQLRDEGHATRIVMFSATIDHALIQRAFAAGAAGFIGKDAHLDVVASGIRTVLNGQRFVDPAVAAELLDEGGQALSTRELQTLQMMADGLTNSAIAKQLSLADDTVKAHVSSILKKLDATSRTAAVATAFRRSMVR